MISKEIVIVILCISWYLYCNYSMIHSVMDLLIYLVVPMSIAEIMLIIIKKEKLREANNAKL